MTTVYGMIHDLYPENSKDAAGVSACKRRSVDRAEHVIGASERISREHSRLWGLTEAKLTVIRLASQ